jgi:hypothetical protein
MSQSETYVKLFRKITEWEWYKDANTARVFIHLLLKASWSGGRYKGHPVEIGQAISGYKATAEALGITERAVRTAFEHLKTTGEVTVKVTSKFSIVTICNYSKYSGGIFENDNQNASQNASQLTSNRQASDKQSTAFKKERKKEGKKEKKDTPSDEGMRLAGLLRDAVLKWKADARTPDSLTAWANDIDKMINIDKRKPESIEAVLKWLPTDNFWPKNVRSGDKLRIQFDVLESGMNKPQPNRQPEAAKNLGPRLTGWPEGTDERYRPRWGNDEAAWLKAKALNDAHHEEQRKKKNAI